VGFSPIAPAGSLLLFFFRFNLLTKRHHLASLLYMDVRGKIVIELFMAKHRDSVKPLSRWIAITENVQWGNFAQVRDTFRSADLFKKDDVAYVIFNIGGNKYRLITEIDYDGTLVVVDIVMTHAEYSKDKWKGRL
jgi:mRNA interferase HigB